MFAPQPALPAMAEPVRRAFWARLLTDRIGQGGWLRLSRPEAEG